ncbi:MAG: hypothetical protein B6A08_19190 [Sorangiineae bacterium NIC37A_2]|nr:MAG: hypothetical protein B6A08_19190 [Sorangiineae bacterium NIC37A_2]
MAERYTTSRAPGNGASELARRFGLGERASPLLFAGFAGERLFRRPDPYVSAEARSTYVRPVPGGSGAALSEIFRGEGRVRSWSARVPSGEAKSTGARFGATPEARRVLGATK